MSIDGDSRTLGLTERANNAHRSWEARSPYPEQIEPFIPVRFVGRLRRGDRGGGWRWRTLPTDKQDFFAGAREVEILAGFLLDEGKVLVAGVLVELRLQLLFLYGQIVDGRLAFGDFALELARFPGLLAEGNQEVGADDQHQHDHQAAAHPAKICDDVCKQVSHRRYAVSTDADDTNSGRRVCQSVACS